MRYRNPEYSNVFITAVPGCYIKRITLALLVSAAFGCSNQMNSGINISPKNFKVQAAFTLSSRGIMINTYWGTGKKHHVLWFDNHSPSWVKDSLFPYNQSFQKSRHLRFKTSAADGLPIQGDVGICDSVFFENLVFQKVPFYVMPRHSKDYKNYDGVFGIDLISKGIWKIDFKSSELTFASSIDSFGELSHLYLLPATFNKQSVTVDVDFGDANVKKMAIDLGYNGNILMPLKEFTKISSPGKVLTDAATFATPAGQHIVTQVSMLDSVHINHNLFLTVVSSNEKVNEQLIGLGFFKRFDYVIFDFINKHIYIPNKN